MCVLSEQWLTWKLLWSAVWWALTDLTNTRSYLNYLTSWSSLNIHSVRTSNAWFRPLQEIHWKPLLTLWHNPPRHSVVVGCVNPTYSSISQKVHVRLCGQQRVQRGLWLCQMLRHRSLNQVDMHSEVVWGKTAFRPSSLFNYFCFQVDFWFAVLAP